MMTEFKFGIFEFLKKVIAGSSVTLAVIYTIGHIVIAEGGRLDTGKGSLQTR